MLAGFACFAAMRKTEAGPRARLRLNYEAILGLLLTAFAT